MILNGSSPGFGISLVAETTKGCFISADTTVSYGHAGESTEFEEEKKELPPPEDIGEQMAYALLGEINQGGVVDSTHQVSVLQEQEPHLIMIFIFSFLFLFSKTGLIF